VSSGYATASHGAASGIPRARTKRGARPCRCGHRGLKDQTGKPAMSHGRFKGLPQDHEWLMWIERDTLNRPSHKAKASLSFMVPAFIVVLFEGTICLAADSA
jgi:hypothetical protein